MRPDGPTAVPAALAALAALAATALPEAQVLRGPIGPRTLDNDVLIVGWSEGASPSVLVVRGEPDYGGRQREDGDVVCILDCYSGDDDFAALCTRAQELLGALEAALQDNAGIGGAVDGAWFGDAMEWTQRADRDGSAVRVAFAVHYVAEL